MSIPLQRQHWFLAAAYSLLTLGFFLQASCRKDSDRQVVHAKAYSIPGYLENPPPLTPESPDPHQLAILPNSESQSAPFFLDFRAKSRSEIRFSFVDPENHEFESVAAQGFSKRLLVYPPADVWAQSLAADSPGPTSQRSYRFASTGWGDVSLDETFEIPRLTYDGERVSIFAKPQLVETTDGAGSLVADGVDEDWAREYQSIARDSALDIPKSYGHVDIVHSAVAESSENLFFLISCRRKPISKEKVRYGFEAGPSGITAESFGAGVVFRYRLEIIDEKMTITDVSENRIMTTSVAKASFALGEVLEIKIKKDTLPAFSPDESWIFRAYAVDFSLEPSIFDRAQPIFFNGQQDGFRQVRGEFGDEPYILNFFVDDAIDQSFAELHLGIAPTIFQDLQKLNQLPIYQHGSIPIFYVANEVNGYTGLNTSDRGILTTVAPNSSLVAISQLMIHEIAHYQNAHNARIAKRWIQEGMSEWSAEKLLYRYFPKKVVYDYVDKLRFKRYLSAKSDAADDFPLDEWESQTDSTGYEKSLMFFDVLTQVVGDPVMHAALKLAYNFPLNSKSFQAVLESLSGKNLKEAFDAWVFPSADKAAHSTKGTEAQSQIHDPKILFADLDHDGLLYLDEVQLGLDPKIHDSDGDGFGDGEEVLAGLSDGLFNPHVGSVKLVSDDPARPNHLLRIAYELENPPTYSKNPFETDFSQTFVTPQFMRPPYTVILAQGGTSTTLTQELIANGLILSVSQAPHNVLPLSAQTTMILQSAKPLSGKPLKTVTDMVDDVPQHLKALDIKRFTLDEDQDFLHINLEFAGKPDIYNADGDYVLTFDSQNWSASSVVNERVFALSFADGQPFLHTFASGTETSSLLSHSIEFLYDDYVLALKVRKTLLSGWIDSTLERNVCVWSQIILYGLAPFKEHGGCLTYMTEYTTSAGALETLFDLGENSIEIFALQGEFSGQQIEEWLDVSVTALRHFETLLARPSFDRSYFKIHVHKGESGSSATGSASRITGAYITLPDDYSQAAKAYLIVEQLARLKISDLLERDSGHDYWIQEFYIQWLTASAMYQMYPSSQVHEFHVSRIEAYRCYVEDPACSANFSSDVPLKSWNAQTLESTASVKTLMLMLVLDAKLGAPALGRLFQVFENQILDSDEIKNALLALVSAEETLIERMWLRSVNGSGDSGADAVELLTDFADGDSDGLYMFEELKLGLDDSQVDDYLSSRKVLAKKMIHFTGF